ncbi:MAG: 16S rRNA methyltransferase [Thermofilum sp.]
MRLLGGETYLKKLLLVLAEAGIELVPKEIRSHPAILKAARARGKEPGETLLDISLHYAAARSLRDWRKRGRPDIAHVCMLVALSSMLNLAGKLELVVHTYNDLVILVDPTTRIPRNYPRFVGLMEQLLLNGRVPPRAEKPLLWLFEGSLEDYLRSWQPDVVILLREGGERISPRRLAGIITSHERPAVIIGAFQHGDFSERVLKLSKLHYSIAEETLDAWYVVARIVSSVEDEVRLYESFDAG